MKSKKAFRKALNDLNEENVRLKNRIQLLEKQVFGDNFQGDIGGDGWTFNFKDGKIAVQNKQEKDILERSPFCGILGELLNDENTTTHTWTVEDERKMREDREKYEASRLREISSTRKNLDHIFPSKDSE